MSEKEKILPFFPLNISLLPGEDIPLRIFEPRYKELINDCFTENMNFGIPFFKNSDIHGFGVECRIKQIIAKNSRGEMVIVVIGVSNFKVLSFKDILPGKLYGGGRVLVFNNDPPVSKEDLQKTIHDYRGNYDPEFLKNIKDKEVTINDVARVLNLSSEDKINYISLMDPIKQQRFLKAQLWYLIKLRQQEKLLNNDFMLN